MSDDFDRHSMRHLSVDHSIVITGACTSTPNAASPVPQLSQMEPSFEASAIKDEPVSSNSLNPKVDFAPVLIFGRYRSQ